MRRALPVLVLLAVFALAAPARADTTRPFDFRTYNGSDGTSDLSPGWAQVNGAVTWFNKQRQVRIAATLTDHCPGDHHGVRVAFIVRFDSGAFYRLVETANTAGCKAAGVPVSAEMPLAPNYGNKITAVLVDLYEKDAETGRVYDEYRKKVRLTDPA
jgi:hypothetical protein